MLLKTIAKSNYGDSWKVGNFKESNQEKKQRAKIKHKELRAITLHGIIAILKKIMIE